MSLMQGILSYAVIWSLCVFLLLPFGVKPPPQPGAFDAPGAPAKAHFRLKLAGAAVMAAAFTLCLKYGIDNGWFPA